MPDIQPSHRPMGSPERADNTQPRSCAGGARYRKKPVEIEAWQNVPDATVPDWFNCKGGCVPGATITIATLEGMMTASPGDWIIRGIKGEVYPCKPDIFAATYEPAGKCAGKAVLEEEVTDACNEIFGPVASREQRNRMRTALEAAAKVRRGKMSDIVERLRHYGWAAHREENCQTAHEAADEIERLRLALAEEQARYPEAYIREAEAQIERLRAPPTEAEVEAAAKAIHDAEYCGTTYPWETESEMTRQGYRVWARTALEAAAKVREER